MKLSYWNLPDTHFPGQGGPCQRSIACNRVPSLIWPVGPYLFVPLDRAFPPEGLHHSRGMAASEFPPLRKIPHCCLPIEWIIRTRILNFINLDSWDQWNQRFFAINTHIRKPMYLVRIYIFYIFILPASLVLMRSLKPHKMFDAKHQAIKYQK